MLAYFLILIITGHLFNAPVVFAFEGKDTYPKIANYYLQPHVKVEHYDDLSKYDLLIMDVDAHTVNPNLIPEIKSKNKGTEVFVYIPSQSVNVEDLRSWAKFRRDAHSAVEMNDWWLRDSSGNNIYFNSTWPTIKFVDIGSGWNDYLVENIERRIDEDAVWDGIFYDMVFANLRWLNEGDIDIDQDGRPDRAEDINSYWQRNTKDLMIKTGNKISQKPVVINIDIPDSCGQNTNGAMMENFPAKWLGDEGWSYLVSQYVNDLPAVNREPQIYVINSNTENTGVMDNYRKMRFGLTTTLLGDGYFSFDYGDIDHSQVWWYDEYNVSLGKARSKPYNILDKQNTEIKDSLWRRDFDKGIVVVNSTDKKQVYSFQSEKFEKINGVQDRRVNNGITVNWISLEPNDGIVLLKFNQEIKNNSFTNGSFVRVFDKFGNQTQNGFFVYRDGYSGNTQVLVVDIDGDNRDEVLVNSNGTITIYKNGKKHLQFRPYDGKFKGEISFAVSDLNNDAVKEIITGAGRGGGPHVRIFNIEGQPLTGGFFAYDENFRGGVNVAVMDLNGDGTKEIITGAGPGGGPHVRVFNKDGQPLIGGFFAYDERFRGGVSVATGDINGSGAKEIITGAGPGGGPHVKVFSKNGVELSSYFAYEPSMRSGIKVMSDDLDRNGVDEILVAVIDY